MLEEADFASHRFDQLRWVVPDPLLEHHLHISYIADARRRITRDYHEICVLSHFDRPGATGAPEKCRAVQCADADRLERCEAALDEQLKLVLVRVAGDDSAGTGGVRAREQQSASTRECQLHCLRLCEERTESGARIGRRSRVALLELSAKLRLEHIQPRRQRATRNEGLENRKSRCECDAPLDELRDQ